ncbi:MAG TPA: NADH-quinone oxidoreductase subunit NuoN [Xanthobacteraceae bacterium]|jgi:NADH-quinone oxidoreductase subunit N|nr:NADH-quinone oxidoreductase subunit NuoN [Xanthobacteraceae bacterium]
MHIAIPMFGPILPELLVLVGALVLLLWGAMRGENSVDTVDYAAIAILLVTTAIVMLEPGTPVETFNGSFVIDNFSRFMKVLVLLGAAATIVLAFEYFRQRNIRRFEFSILLLTATAGMMIMISARDLITLYLGFELMSLSLYVIAAIDRDNLRSTEAGLKYFVLSALASGMLLYGSSLIYGFTGTVSFAGIAAAAKASTSTGLIFGLVFLFAGIVFKISAVPFHMWTPDVYEGAPTPVTAYFAAAPKVAAMALLIRVALDAFPTIVPQWKQIIIFISIASMMLGSFAAIGQRNIKRMMAYSSIGHIGFALIGLAAGTPQGVQGVLIYMAIYVAMTLGTFACILAMRRKGGNVEDIDQLAGLARTQPLAAMFFAALLFSLAGIPPLAGFFAKFYVFLAAIDAKLYTLAVIGVVTSVIGAYYYLRIVKIMYMDEPAEPFLPMPNGLRVILGIFGLFVIFFFAYPSPLVAAAEAAAKSLF